MVNARKSREDRAAKVEAMRREQAAKARRRRLLLLTAGLVVVLLVGAAVTAVVLDLRQRARDQDLSAVRSFTGLGRDHVEGEVTYPQTPPVGGNHNIAWLNCGIYEQQVPNVNAVHSLEHGAVWITYRPDLGPKARSTLEDLVRGQTYLVLSPYEGLPAPVVASAWGKQLTFERASDPRLRAFVRAFKQGAQTPEPGAACTGGTGTPLA